MSTEDFDREINVRGVIWTGAALVLVALVASVVVFLLLRGYSAYDRRHDEPLTPIQAAAPPQDPPEPRLQVDPNKDMADMRADEDQRVDSAGWVNRQQGTVRVPLDVAMDVIAARGVSPQVVGGTGAAAPAPATPQSSTPQGRDSHAVTRHPGR